jgi:hypothetical protein
MSRSTPIRSRLATAALLVAVGAVHAADEPKGPTVTGHVDLVSRYILRGATTTYGNSKPSPGNAVADAPESDQPALQWGADYALPSGLAFGYFGSTINYSYRQLGASYSDRTITSFQNRKSIENDLYATYTGSMGRLGYVVGGTAYAYINGRHANALETKLGLSYGDFALNAQTLLNDVVWGNAGDTYWTLNYTKSLPMNIAFNASLGAYTYAKEGKYLGTRDTRSGADCAANEAFNVNGCYVGTRPIGSGLRHLIVGVTQPIASTGLTWGLQAVFGGKNRFGINQNNRLVGSISYGF